MQKIDWSLALIQLPPSPSRHRVGVWRELRRAGAVPIGSGTWLFPSTGAFETAIGRVRELTERGEGTIAVVRADPRDEQAEGVLRAAFASARVDEWTEFIDDCRKFEEEIDREFAKQKFTLGELEEEEQSLERLRRWFATVQQRDVLGVPEGETAKARLEHCETRLGEYADRVYATVESSSDASGVLPTQA